jgi:hypothetical protein
LVSGLGNIRAAYNFGFDVRNDDLSSSARQNVGPDSSRTRTLDAPIGHRPGKIGHYSDRDQRDERKRDQENSASFINQLRSISVGDFHKLTL